MIVLDTNVVSELMKPEPEAHVLNWLAQFNDGVLATTSMSVAEIEYGLQRLPDGKRKAELYARFEAYISVLQVLPFDEGAARVAGRFWAAQQAAGFNVQPPDIIIAGVTAAAGAMLATRNTKDFQNLPITVIDPWRAH